MLSICCATLASAQDVHFSQIFETPLKRNPALAGVFTGDLRLQAVHRSQWNSVTDGYQTSALSGEYKIPVGYTNDFITVGVQLLYDKAGTVNLSTAELLPAVNYHKSLSDERNIYFSAAIMGGVVERKFDLTKVTTNSQYNGGAFDPNLPTGENFSRTGYRYFDGSVGLSLNAQLGENADNNIYIAAGYHHFNKPKNLSFFSNTNIEMKPRWVYSLGLRTNVNDYSFFTIQGDYSMQGDYREIVGGALYSLRLDDIEDSHKLLHIGSYVRWSDAIIPVAKLEFKPLTISLSYDVNISPLKKASYGRGGFELALSYIKSLNRSSSSNDPSIRCPRF